MPRTRIERIIKQDVGITSDTALRLARYFDMTPNFWMNLQLAFDLAVSAEELREELEAIEPRESAIVR